MKETTLFILPLLLAIIVVRTNGYVPVLSCGVDEGERKSCGNKDYNAERCEEDRCCFEEPVCFKPDYIRAWDQCSRKCDTGIRTEEHTGWQMNCSTLPCQLKTPGKCPRADIMFIVDDSNDVNERSFWARKQLIIDIVRLLAQVSHDTRFAMITYTQSVKIRFRFEDGYNLETQTHMTLKIWKMEYEAAKEHGRMAIALRKAVQIFQEQPRIDDEGVNRIAIVITNGMAADEDDLPAAVDALKAEANIYAIGKAGIHDVELIKSLTEMDSHVFTLGDYKTRQNLVIAIVTEMCCRHGVRNALSIKCDDVCDVYVEEELQDTFTFKQHGIFIVSGKYKNLVAIKLTNKINPNGRYFELYPTGAAGGMLLSIPSMWRCSVQEEKKWYKLKFDDSHWTPAQLAPRKKDIRHIGHFGEKRIWPAGDDWHGYCRGWVMPVCNVTYLPGVTCKTGETHKEGYGGCEGAYDGRLSGKNGWIAKKRTENPWMEMDFGREHEVIGVHILNRCGKGDQIKRLKITFGDGSIEEMGLRCDAYSRKSGQCNGQDWIQAHFDPPIKTRSMRLDVLSSCDDPPRWLGLREIRVISNPPCFL